MFPGMKLPPKAIAAPPMAAPEPEFEPEVPMREEMPGAVDISPEAVCYRDERQVCANCSYMGESSECAALRMIVDPAGGCNLFKEVEGGEMPDA